MTVADDGVGPPEGFSVEATTGLGLSIVRTLVTTELGGTIEFRGRRRRPADRPGTVVRLVGAGRRTDPARGPDATTASPEGGRRDC